MTQTDLAPRRVQFSSCDQCRRSRVACDAARGHGKDDAAKSVSCTRCLNRQQGCTFDWMKDSTGSSSASRTSSRAKATATRARKTGRRRETETPTDTPDRSASCLSCGLSKPAVPSFSEEAISPNVSEWLRCIYEGAFETIFGSWMGKYSNPFTFGEQSLSDVSVSISRVCEQLDRWMDEDYVGDDGSPSTRRNSRMQIDQSLKRAIHAFAARWLPLTDSSSDAEMVRSLWRAARQDMLKVVNRPSYRSMWALLLFALTPIPVGVSEEEELIGVSGQVCVHAALQQIQTLRARQRSLQFNGAEVNLTAPPTPGLAASPRSLATANFIIAESTAYWAALTFDTSASLTLSCRPLLSSGLFGFESESSWRMVRTCRKIFHETSRAWVADFEVDDERANQIIAAGAAWKLLVWKLTANMKEALRDGHDEPQVSSVFQAVTDAIDQWNVTYRDLMAACQTRILFLSQETKLRWYELMMHYHLSILVGVDMLEATGRHDLLTKFSAKRVEAESCVLNCLVFGLNNQYTISQGEASITVPIIAIDPYAHHAVAAVKLMQQAIDRASAARKITADAYANLFSTLTQALQHLPASSKSVQAARSKVPSQPLYSHTSMGC